MDLSGWQTARSEEQTPREASACLGCYPCQMIQPHEHKEGGCWASED